MSHSRGHFISGRSFSTECFCEDTANMDLVSKHALEILTEVEEAAEDVLSTKQQVNKTT